MRESLFWQSLRKGLLAKSNNEIFLQRIENKVQEGMPDVFYMYRGHAGFIELKYLKKYPKRDTSKLDFNLTFAQRLWMHTYTKKGGKGFYLIRIEDDIFLIQGNFATELAELTAEKIRLFAVTRWKSKAVDYFELLNRLQYG